MDAYRHFIRIAETCKQTRCPSLCEQINYGTCRQWNIIQDKKN